MFDLESNVSFTYVPEFRNVTVDAVGDPRENRHRTTKTSFRNFKKEWAAIDLWVSSYTAQSSL